MPLFTVETAAEMGRRSAELAKQRKQERALILASPPLTTELATDYSQSKAERTRKQIELIDQMIEQSDDADQLDALTRSKERLFRIWARLVQLPMDPKPAVVKTRSQSYPTLDPRPIEPVRESLSQPVSQPQAQPQSVPQAKPGA